MSAMVDYAPSAGTDERAWLTSQPLKRLIIAAAGCAVMALSGSGLANYLNTSTAARADASLASQADAASIN